ncbi:unnamed protein product [Prunus armeniaca]
MACYILNSGTPTQQGSKLKESSLRAKRHHPIGALVLIQQSSSLLRVEPAPQTAKRKEGRKKRPTYVQGEWEKSLDT